MQITSVGIIVILCFYIGINGENLELSAEKLLSKLDSSHDLFMKVSNAVLKKIVDYQILSEKLENWKAVTSDLDEVTKGVRSAAESTLNAMIENPSRFTPQDKVKVKQSLDNVKSMLDEFTKELIDEFDLLPQDLDSNTDELCQVLGYFCQLDHYFDIIEDRQQHDFNISKILDLI